MNVAPNENENENEVVSSARKSVNFDFSRFYKQNNGEYKHVSSEFLEWFVGFFEGDGSLVVNHRNDQSFVLTQHTKDIQVQEKIKETQGFGSVLAQGPTCFRFIVNNQGDLYKILLILNGNLCIPSRIRGLDKFTKAFNKKVPKNRHGKYFYLKEICRISTLCIPTVHDAWFLGFIDAEGCFTCSFLKGSSTYRIRRIVTQKHFENLPVLSHFIVIFGVGRIEKHSKKDVYSFIVSGLKNCKKLKFYFDTFTLQTKKAKRYTEWCELQDHIENKDHLDPTKIQSLIEKAVRCAGKSTKKKIRLLCTRKNTNGGKKFIKNSKKTKKKTKLGTQDILKWKV